MLLTGRGREKERIKRQKLILPTNSAPGLSDSQCSTYPNNTYTAGRYGYVCAGHITGANLSKLAYSIISHIFYSHHISKEKKLEIVLLDRNWLPPLSKGAFKNKVFLCIIINPDRGNYQQVILSEILSPDWLSSQVD